jgi:cytochrome c
MDSMEVNKAVAAVLVAGITFFVTGTLGTILVQEHTLDKPAIKIDVPEAAPAAGQAPEVLPPVANLLAKADIGAGQAYASKVCAACHTFTPGGKAGVGPNLYNVVGGPHAHMEGFNYSTALKSKTGPWTFDELNEWLHKPSAYAPGTRMSFAGISNDQERANVIDYLHTLSPNPEPLPPPVAVSAPAAAANAASPPATSAEPPIATLLASANAAAGEADTKKLGCIACHTFNEGGRAGLGPNLYGVVGGPHAHMAGFNYSSGLKAKQGPWTFAELNEWLTKPSAYVPGTRMTFVGIKDPKERADVIAYLRSLSANPEPLPAN